jgi:predicted AAA+ superfamily ATPase
VFDPGLSSQQILFLFHEPRSGSSAELRKQYAREANSASLWFYRDSTQREVDFLIVRGNQLDLIEAKWGENPDARDARALESVATTLAEKGSRPEVRSFIVCRTPHPTMVGSKTSVITLSDLAAR